MGVPGPCGPCSEIYFDRGAAYGKEGGPIADEDRYLEIWNLVFMQNIRGEGGGKESFPILGELPAKNIDTGLGLERTAALLQGVENIYEIDTTQHILNRASDLSGVSYGKATSSDVSLRVIADHARTATMLIGDGVTPGNEGRGYVLRRMMRRTTRNMKLLGADDRNMSELVKASIEAMGPQYPELQSDSVRILKVAEAEEESFLQTLKSGTLIFDQRSASLKKSGTKVLSGEDVFQLHDTYGFPFDLTLEMANEEGLSIDAEGFTRLMKQQRERAKADAKSKTTVRAGDLSVTAWAPADAAFLLASAGVWRYRMGCPGTGFGSRKAAGCQPVLEVSKTCLGRICQSRGTLRRCGSGHVNVLQWHANPEPSRCRNSGDFQRCCFGSGRCRGQTADAAGAEVQQLP